MNKNDAEIKNILERITNLKKELNELGELRPGSISKQFNVCGNPSCRCKDKQKPQKHGPYHKLSYKRKGKGHTQFIKEDDLENVTTQVENYKKMKELTDEWVELSIELIALKKTV